MAALLTSLRFLVASDVRVVRRGSDAFATHPAGEYEAFLPLRETCKDVRVISRDATSSSEEHSVGGPLTGEGVTHVGVPDFSSWTGMLQGLPRTAGTVWNAVGAADAVFVRLPEPLSVLVALVALARRKPVIANLVADPASLVLTGPSRMIQVVLVRLTSAIVKRAHGVIYVTRSQLQRSFPAKPSVPTLARSNVRLSFVADAPRAVPANGRIGLLTVGTTSRLSKGQDVLLEAIPILVSRGLDPTLVLVGGGDRTAWLEQRAAELGIADRCSVRGHISDRAEVQDAYDHADVFCLPSRSEGLPRALIEAMAHGLPAVGSRAGGIPELLPEPQLLDELTPEVLADAIHRLVADPAAYKAASAAALALAKDIDRSTSTPILRTFLQEALEVSR